MQNNISIIIEEIISQIDEVDRNVNLLMVWCKTGQRLYFEQLSNDYEAQIIQTIARIRKNEPYTGTIEIWSDNYDLIIKKHIY